MFRSGFGAQGSCLRAFRFQDSNVPSSNCATLYDNAAGASRAVKKAGRKCDVKSSMRWRVMKFGKRASEKGFPSPTKNPPLCVKNVHIGGHSGHSWGERYRYALINSEGRNIDLMPLRLARTRLAYSRKRERNRRKGVRKKQKVAAAILPLQAPIPCQ